MCSGVTNYQEAAKENLSIITLWDIQTVLYLVCLFASHYLQMVKKAELFDDLSMAALVDQT